jgi:hypothetical protein
MRAEIGQVVTLRSDGQENWYFVTDAAEAPESIIIADRLDHIRYIFGEDNIPVLAEFQRTGQRVVTDNCEVINANSLTEMAFVIVD